MKLSIITVNTNEWRVLQTCLRTIFEQTNGIDFEVIVVDNASTDDSVENIRKHFPQVKILLNSKNRGFAASNNTGIAAATGEYILLLNPDTEILDSAIQKSVYFADAHPRAGIVGCKLLFENRQVQYSVGTFPSVLNGFLNSTFAYLILPRSTLIGRTTISFFDYTRQREVDWVCGAYLLIKRAVIGSIGVLDEQFFLYSEETDFCLRARQAGFEVWFTPEPQVIHFWGGINAVTRRSLLWTVGSQLLYMKKHHRGAAKGVMIFLKYLGLALRVPVYAMMGVVLFKKKLLTKAYYCCYVIGKLLIVNPQYKRDFHGEVVPWNEAW